MSLISPADQEHLRTAFSEMTRAVRIVFVTQTIGCETCAETRQIIDELPPLSDRIGIDEVNLVLEGEKAKQYGIDRAPGLALLYEDGDGVKDSRIRFLGAPSGYEFISLVQAVLLAGGRATNLTDENRARLAALDKPLSLQVFTTPT